MGGGGVELGVVDAGAYIPLAFAIYHMEFL